MLQKGETPTKREVIPPDEGWKSGALYLVLVSYGVGNPIHEAFFQVGYLTRGAKPGGNSYIWLNSYDEANWVGEAYYLRAVKKLHPT